METNTSEMQLPILIRTIKYEDKIRQVDYFNENGVYISLKGEEATRFGHLSKRKQQLRYLIPGDEIQGISRMDRAIEKMKPGQSMNDLMELFRNEPVIINLDHFRSVAVRKITQFALYFDSNGVYSKTTVKNACDMGLTGTLFNIHNKPVISKNYLIYILPKQMDNKHTLSWKCAYKIIKEMELGITAKQFLEKWITEYEIQSGKSYSLQFVSETTQNESLTADGFRERRKSVILDRITKAAKNEHTPLTTQNLDFDVHGLTGIDLINTYATVQKRLYNADVIRISNPVFTTDGQIISGTITELDDGTLSEIIDGNLGSYIRSLTNTGIYRVKNLKTDGNLNILSGSILELIE